MKCIVISENSSMEGLGSEWGLSFYIEHEGWNFLVDAGASGLFLKNAEKLNIDIGNVSAAMLSHAHYDHARGMRSFFEANKSAAFYLSGAATENCYSKHFIIKKYIGIDKGILAEFEDRINYCSELTEVCGGSVFVLPHYKMPVSGTKSMYVKGQMGYEKDTFRHEQSIIFLLGTEEKRELVVFSPCSHLGVPTIIEEVREQFPGIPIKALLGGFHLFTKSKGYIEDLAGRMAQLGIEKIYTGHCTGDRAYNILEEQLGERLYKLTAGLVIEL
ncbi:MAG: MBL fold metallo-hydrolase [Lachnospiraceae bacterium]|nr:MBL fold metallo-hydrolase [Lachnospiraceae bacterium]